MKKEKTALAISGGLGVLIFGATFFLLSNEYKEEYPNRTIDQELVDSSGDIVDKGEIATAGQTFIQTMASYNQEQNQPIKLMSVEKVNSIWQAKYEVEQVFDNDLSLVYFYTVDIDQGHVVRQNVSVSDRSRRLLVSNPEPESIVEQKAFTVKGQVFDGQTEVSLSLRDESGRVVVQQVLPVMLENDGVYSRIINLTEDLYGDFVLEVTDGQSTVQSNIVVTPSD